MYPSDGTIPVCVKWSVLNRSIDTSWNPSQTAMVWFLIASLRFDTIYHRTVLHLHYMLMLHTSTTETSNQFWKQTVNLFKDLNFIVCSFLCALGRWINKETKLSLMKNLEAHVWLRQDELGLGLGSEQGRFDPAFRKTLMTRRRNQKSLPTWLGRQLFFRESYFFCQLRCK